MTVIEDSSNDADSIPSPMASSAAPENIATSFAPTQFDCLGTAVQFLTRVSMVGMTQMTTEQYAVALRGGVQYFPLVGGCIGAWAAFVFWGSSFGLSLWIAALLALGSEALLTGAFHEDAFADTFDALGGGWTREGILEIMKDSRLGTYGTLALVIGVGIRAACFVALIQGHNWMWACTSIIAAASLGRLAIVAIMVTTSPINDRRSQARDVSGMQTARTFLTASIISVPTWIFWLWLGSLQAFLTLALTVLILYAYRRYILWRVGGTTGDLLGCTAYIAQLAILIGSSWHEGSGG